MAELIAVIVPAALALFAVRFVLLVWPTGRGSCPIRRRCRVCRWRGLPRRPLCMLCLIVANRNHRRLGSQSSDGRAQNDCTRSEGPDPQSLRMSP